MLGLKTATDPSWIHQVELHLEEVLLDHAHCEKKAAASAMAMVPMAGTQYTVGRPDMTRY